VAGFRLEHDMSWTETKTEKLDERNAMNGLVAKILGGGGGSQLQLAFN
jgi:hypothetical protein